MTDRCWVATAYIYDMNSYDGNTLQGIYLKDGY
jgi:hypothetical protein